MSEEITAIFTEHDHGDDSPDVEHKTPYDRTGTSAWLLEDATKDGNVLTQDGIFQIVHHKYKGGEYTHLDESLNPMWTSLAELLPMSMAPNLVSILV